MLRFAANLSLLFTDRPLSERFAAARAAGFAAVEIQFPYDTPLAELLAARRDSGLEVVLINVPAGDLMQGGAGLAGVPGREAEFAAALAATLPYAQALGVSAVNVLPGRLAEGATHEAALATLEHNLRLAAHTLAEAGIRATTEAINTVDMPGFLLSSSAEMLAMLQRVGHPNLAMQVDLYHLARMGEDLEALLERHIARIGHIQFADVPGRGAPGSGTLDFERLFALIGRLPYPDWCGAEYRWQAGDDFSWLTPWRTPEQAPE